MKPSPVEGSKLWRTWCIRCGEPMLTDMASAHEGGICLDCRGRPRQPLAKHLTERQLLKLGEMDREEEC